MAGLPKVNGSSVGDLRPYRARAVLRFASLAQETRNACPRDSFNTIGRVPHRCAAIASGYRPGGTMNDVSGSTHVSGFDGDLQMFREAPKPINMAHLEFLRWLIEQGRLDHPSAQPSSGESADAGVPTPS